MPRKRLPEEIKRARGTDQPCRASVTVVDFPKAQRVPDPPDWLTAEEALELWNEVAPSLVGLKVLAMADVHALAHMCHLHGELVDMYRRRITPPTAMLNQLRMLMSEFGMTPASRTKAAKLDDSGKGNAFGRNGRKQKASSSAD